MLARRPAAEVLAGHDDLVRRTKFVIRMERDMSLGQPGLSRRHAAQRVLAKLPIFLGDGGVERQVLGRNDLVGIDVVAQDVSLAGDSRLHSP